MSTRESREAEADDARTANPQPEQPQPEPQKPAHRWTPEEASRAGRTGGQAARRPKGLGKKGKRR